MNDDAKYQKLIGAKITRIKFYAMIVEIPDGNQYTIDSSDIGFGLQDGIDQFIFDD